MSLGEFLQKKSKSRRLYEFVIDTSRKDRTYSFLFDGIFEEMIEKSVKISELNLDQSFALRSIVVEKLANEALERIHGESDSLWSKFYQAKISRILLDTISYLPLAFGMPPLKLPGFITENETLLVNAKSVDEIKKIFNDLSDVNSKIRDLVFLLTAERIPFDWMVDDE
jgi:hypothetical protein